MTLKEQKKKKWIENNWQTETYQNRLNNKDVSSYA